MMWEPTTVPNDDAVLTDTLPLNAFTTSILERTGNESDLLSEEEIERVDCRDLAPRSTRPPTWRAEVSRTWGLRRTRMARRR